MSDQRSRPITTVLGLRLGIAKSKSKSAVVVGDLGSLGALIQRGRAALEDGDLDRARAALASAQAAAPEARDVLLLQALVQAGGGDDDDAGASFDRALALFPDDVALVASKALWLLDDVGDAAAALPLLEEALAFANEADAGDDADEDDLAALCALLGRRLVEARLDAGDVEGAIAAAREALAIEDDPDTRAALGAALYSAGDVDDAAVVIAAAGDAPVAALHLIAARVAVARGDEAGAQRSFSRAVALDGELAVPPRLPPARFKAIVDDVVARVPEPLRGYLAEVPVDVAAVVDLPRLQAAHRSPGTPLLIEGPARLPGSGDPFDHRPLAAVLFQRNVELLAQDEDDVAAVVTAVLVESFGAFLALDIEDDELDPLADPGSDEEATDDAGDDDDD
ncbi:MAG: tetratricopeptide repeat protein [Deltaproteobacteria bacterium]|nr:tetratricopeptide repeat protein [Deltaproteobacteria bacterium]